MLTVKALRCVNLRNVALSGSNERQDPYVTLTLEENQKLHTKTDVCYSGGTTPHWFQGNWMRLPIHQSNMTCLVQVWDKHSGDADELIASGRINLSRYDEDGAEEEPTSVDLFWQNGEPAGKFHCILSYDPPYSQVQPQDDTLTGKGDAQQQGVDESWMPWIRLKVKHKSGQVKDYVISRSRLRIDTGRDFLSTRVPQARAMVDNLVTNFRNRTVLEQAGFIALAILLIAVPYPRMFVGWTYHSVHDSLAWLWSSFYAATFGALASMFNSVWAGVRWAFSWNWAIATTVLKWTSIISLFTVVPALAVLCGPRAIGFALTKLATFMTGGHIIAFGTVTFVPWITDFKRLKMRFILVDFLLGNPRDKGYTPRLASFNRVEFVGSISFADIFNAMRFNYIRTPLKDVPDYDKLALVRIDHLEIDGLTINLEVNDKNKLNLPELISSFDRAQVNRALMKRDINPETFRFPNCLEVQVLGARNLRSMGLNGLADPFYSVRVRKQVLNSETVVKTLNPAFPPRVEQFFVDDPSAVVNVEIRDENIGRTSDFIGQWNITAKWLLMDPKNVRHIEWERLSESDRRQGWIGFWAPLVDEHFRQEGMCGEVHLRLRWVYNPALPVFRPGERKETQTPLQQLNMARREIRERLGDLEKIFDILKHFPILLDFEGAMLINDTKVSVHDVLFGRRRDEDNVVKRILTKQQEENEHRTSKKVMSLPRSVGIRETPVALDRDQLDSEMMAAQRDILSSTTTDQSKGIDPVDEVVVTSIDPSGAKLPKNLEIDVDTFAPGVRQEQLVQEGTIKGEASSSTFVEPSSLQNQQERYDESRIGLQQPMEKSDVPPPTTSDLAMKDTLESEIGTTDKLNAVYPEKLVSSAIGTNDSGYVRGDLAKMRRDLDAADADVYLGGEEDDDAAEERNEDRFDDDDREFDQDGREFVKIKTIMWRKQFMKRHGDPGINLYKFLERLVFGLIPKLSADARLQKAVAGSAFKGFFKGEMPIFSLNKEERSGAPGVSTETGTGRTSGVTGKIRSMAHSVKDQAKLVTHKITHQRQDEQVAAAAIRGLDASHAQEGEEALRAERIVKGGEEEKSPEPVATTRPVHGTDADFNDSNLLIAGGLEAVWQGRHRITSLFRRWKPWHMEIKGDTVFYHRTTVAGLSTSTASDSVWYTLDLTWLADMYMTDSSRIHNNELVLKFVQDDNSLHLRLPSRVTTPTLDNWLAALRKVARVQQDRRRLGTAASMGNESESGYQTNSTSAWPGEDAQPQQRQRGSSLAVNLAVPTQALMKEQVASVDVVKPNQMESGQYQATINPNSKIDAYQVNESSGRESAPTVKPTQMGSSTKEAPINPNYKVDFSDAGDRTKILNQQSPNKTSMYYSDQSYKPNEPPSYKPTSEISEEPERKQKLPLANFVEPQHPPKTVEFESQPQKTFTTPTMQTASAQTVITPNQVAQS